MGSDLIGYDALTSYGSPSYWTQVMFSTHLGTEVVSSTLDHAPVRVYASVTRDNKKHKLFCESACAFCCACDGSVDAHGSKLKALSKTTSVPKNRGEHDLRPVAGRAVAGERVAGMRSRSSLMHPDRDIF